MELNLLTANTVLLNHRSRFKTRWMSHSNPIVSLIREVCLNRGHDIGDCVCALMCPFMLFISPLGKPADRAIYRR